MTKQLLLSNYLNKDVIGLIDDYLVKKDWRKDKQKMDSEFEIIIENANNGILSVQYRYHQGDEFEHLNYEVLLSVLEWYTYNDIITINQPMYDAQLRLLQKLNELEGRRISIHGMTANDRHHYYEEFGGL